MADLFEAGIEALRQHMHVIVQGFCRGMESLVGHHYAGREIVGQRDAVEPAWSIVELAGTSGDGLDRAAGFGERDLEGKLERAAGAVHEFGDQELPAMRSEEH